MPDSMDESDDVEIPTLHEAQAAFIVSQIIGERLSSRKRIRSGYPRVATEGLYSPSDLRRGERILVLSGLVEDLGDGLRGTKKLTHLESMDERAGAKLILKIFLQKNRPAWVSVAVGDGGVYEEYIPDRALRVLNTAFPDTQNRNSVLFGLLSSVDRAGRVEIGEMGERRVVAACRSQRHESGYAELAEQVRQVSKISDSLGYDIAAPCPGGDHYHIEVKTVGKDIQALQFYLSRNQYEVGLRDPNWRLVICKREEEETSIVGWCSIDVVQRGVPEERKIDWPCSVRWEEVRVRMRDKPLDPGLPPLQC